MPPRTGEPSAQGTTRIPTAPPRPPVAPPPVPAPDPEPQTTRLSVAKNVVRSAVSGAAAAAQRARSDKPAAPQPREDREIESWLGDLRGTDAPAGPPQPLRPSAEPTRAMPDTVSNEPTTAIPQAHGDEADDAAPTRAIPAQRKTDADAATEKLNTRPDSEDAPRRGGGGLSAQDLLRREGRL